MAIQILALAGEAYAAWCNVQKLRQFVADGPMVGILQELGEDDLQTAIAALQAAHDSVEPRREVMEAIGHLRRAATGFLESIRKRRVWGVLGPTPQTRFNGLRNAIEANVLMAVCYQYLGEARQAQGRLRDADALWDGYAEAVLDLVRDSFRARGAEIGLEMGTSDSGFISGMDDWNEMRQDEDEALARQRNELAEEREVLRKMVETLAAVPAPGAPPPVPVGAG